MLISHTKGIQLSLKHEAITKFYFICQLYISLQLCQLLNAQKVEIGLWAACHPANTHVRHHVYPREPQFKNKMW